jgi:phosphopantothenoylcysteine decarboxylase/phosphopantothenate--cysteine ligase
MDPSAQAHRPDGPRRVLLGVTGGIACYKAAALASRLVQSDIRLTVMMTEAATRFITPLTFQSLSGRPVYTSLWQSATHPDAEHVGLARDAQLVVIAPATANIIAKIAHGICDDLVSTVMCAIPTSTPVLIAPAMNHEMWTNPITQNNAEQLKALANYHFVGPETGWQACRTDGTGRMSEPQAIAERAMQLLDQGSA